MRTYEKYYIFVISMMVIVIFTNGDDSDEKFYNDLLNFHNEYREKHHAPPLELEKNAIEEAIYTIYNWNGDKNKLPHPVDYGYNVYWNDITNKPQPTAEEVFLAWYDTKRDYQYSLGSMSEYKFTSEFTQIVWKESKNLGLARLIKDNHFIVIATYNPPGNVRGYYLSNVAEP